MLGNSKGTGADLFEYLAALFAFKMHSLASPTFYQN